MPEIKNTFVQGKMNKDLDERLIPNGQYRDALNVEVSTSEDSDVGVVKNVLGNYRVEDKVPGGFTCVGSIANEKTNKIYWFVSSYSKDAIVEYDIINDITSPILVDTNAGNYKAVLKFSGNIITGINIIDNLLFWTDNNSEPKKINIEECRKGTVDMDTHTQLVFENGSFDGLTIEHVAKADVDQPGASSGLYFYFNTKKFLKIINTWEHHPGDSGNATVMRTPIRHYRDGQFLGSFNINFFNSTNWPNPDLDPNVANRYTKNSINYVEDASYPGIIPSEVGGYPGTGTKARRLSGENSTSDFMPGDVIFGESVKIDIEERHITVIKPKPLNTLSVKINHNDSDTDTSNIPNLFETKFPRFSYRYKYRDGEYSAFAPFTKPVFNPKYPKDPSLSFDSDVFYNKDNAYDIKEPYNKAMINSIHSVELSDFIDAQTPEDVVEIDILYKQEESSVIYSIDTIKHVDGEWHRWGNIEGANIGQEQSIGGENYAATGGFTVGKYIVTTENIYAALPANQLLRPWDNVPKKALAQEITGSRIVYGNYVQNYDLINNTKISVNYNPRKNNINTFATHGLPSIKSQRNYQVGIVYSDKYGRETPVFTSIDGAVKVPWQDSSGQKNASKSNQLNVSVVNNFPEWVDSLKFFVKETSNEYYNLTMDRAWVTKSTYSLDNSEGHIWISFPSSDRNKVSEEDYIILKKKIGVGEEQVSFENKFKIIDIKNEAPDAIKYQLNNLGILRNGEFNADSFTQNVGAFSTPELGSVISDWPSHYDVNTGRGTNTLRVAIDPWRTGQSGQGNPPLESDEGAATDDPITTKDLYISWFREESGKITSSKKYKIISGKLGPTNYVLRLEDHISKEDADIAHVLGDSSQTTSPGSGPNASLDPATQLHPNLALQIEKRELRESEDFSGKFFVKISKNQVTNLITDNQKVDILNQFQVKSKRSSWYWEDDIGTQAHHVSNTYGLLNHNGAKQNPTGEKSIRHAKNNNDGVTTLLDANGNTLKTTDWHEPWQGILDNFEPTFFVDSMHMAAGQSEVSDYAKYCCITWAGLGAEEPTEELAWSYPPLKTWLGEFEDVSGVQQSLADGSVWYNNNLISTSPVLNNNADFSDLKVDGWVGPLQKVNRRSLNNSGGDPVYSANNNHINGLEGFVTTTDDHATGPRRWFSGITGNNTEHGVGVDTKTYSTNNEIDRHFMHLSFFAPGKDLHPDNWGDMSGQSLYGANSWAANLQGIWGGGVFTGGDSYQVFGTENGHVHLAMEGNYDGNNNPLPQPAGPGVGYGYNTDYRELHERQWDPTFNEKGDPDNKIRNFIRNLHPGSRFRFNKVNPPGDDFGSLIDNTIYTIKNVKIKKLYNHTSWRQTNNRYHSGAGGYFPPNPHIDYQSVEEAGLAWLSQLPDIGNGGANPNDETNKFKNKIKQFGKAHNRRVCYIIELDKNPADSTSTLGNPIGDSDVMSADFDSDTYCDIEFLDDVVSPLLSDLSKFPAIWEVDPKKKEIDLDIYYEASDSIPVRLNNRTNELFAPIGCKVEILNSNIAGSSVLEYWDGNVATFKPGFIKADAGVEIDYTNMLFKFIRDDGSYTIAEAGEQSLDGGNVGFKTEFVFREDVGSNITSGLSWYNCIAFGNGLESNRIRDGFNEVFISNGVKASTTTQETYKEERRAHGLIYSGLYNSNSGINDLNQFIMAEKITKDLNPTYGSIQKLFSRNTDLITFCEDKVLKILANKDAVFNADGNTQLTASENVLGQTVPFVGDYGISKNPESFASESYRAYFTDKQRGAVLRLSRDGLTPISEAGMNDWFRDNLSQYHSLIGTYDNYKKDYNLTLANNDAFFENLISDTYLKTGDQLSTLTVGLANSILNPGVNNGFQLQYLYETNNVIEYANAGNNPFDWSAFTIDDYDLKGSVTVTHHEAIHVGGLQPAETGTGETIIPAVQYQVQEFKEFNNLVDDGWFYDPRFDDNSFTVDVFGPQAFNNRFVNGAMNYDNQVYSWVRRVVNGETVIENNVAGHSTYQIWLNDYDAQGQTGFSTTYDPKIEKRCHFPHHTSHVTGGYGISTASGMITRNDGSEDGRAGSIVFDRVYDPANSYVEFMNIGEKGYGLDGELMDEYNSNNNTSFKHRTFFNGDELHIQVRIKAYGSQHQSGSEAAGYNVIKPTIQILDGNDPIPNLDIRDVQWSNASAYDANGNLKTSSLAEHRFYHHRTAVDPNWVTPGVGFNFVSTNGANDDDWEFIAPNYCAKRINTSGFATGNTVVFPSTASIPFANAYSGDASETIVVNCSFKFQDRTGKYSNLNNNYATSPYDQEVKARKVVDNLRIRIWNSEPITNDSYYDDDGEGGYTLDGVAYPQNRVLYRQYWEIERLYVRKGYGTTDSHIDFEDAYGLGDAVHAVEAVPPFLVPAWSEVVHAVNYGFGNNSWFLDGTGIGGGNEYTTQQDANNYGSQYLPVTQTGYGQAANVANPPDQIINYQVPSDWGYGQSDHPDLNNSALTPLPAWHEDCSITVPGATFDRTTSNNNNYNNKKIEVQTQNEYIHVQGDNSNQYVNIKLNCASEPWELNTWYLVDVEVDETYGDGMGAEFFVVAVADTTNMPGVDGQVIDPKGIGLYAGSNNSAHVRLQQRTRIEYGNPDGSGDNKNVLRAIFQAHPNSYRMDPANLSRRDIFNFRVKNCINGVKVNKIIAKKLSAESPSIFTNWLGLAGGGAGSADNWIYEHGNTNTDEVVHAFDPKKVYYKNSSLNWDVPAGSSHVDILGDDTYKWEQAFATPPVIDSTPWEISFNVTNHTSGSLHGFIGIDDGTNTGIPQGVYFSDITEEGRYKFRFTFDNDITAQQSDGLGNTEDIWRIQRSDLGVDNYGDPNLGYEPVLDTLSSLTASASYPHMVDKIHFSNQDDTVDSKWSINNIQLINGVSVFTGGSAGSWNFDGFNTSTNDYIFWDITAENLVFDSCPLFDDEDKFININQQIEETISRYNKYKIRFTHTIQQPGAKLSVYYYNSDGYGFKIDDIAHDSWSYDGVTYTAEYDNNIGQYVVEQDVVIGDSIWQPINEINSTFSPNLKNSFTIEVKGVGDEIVEGSIDNIRMSQLFNPYVDADDKTLTFNENVNGWVSFKDFIPENGVSISKKYFTFNHGGLYQHYVPLRVDNGGWVKTSLDEAENYNRFYNNNTYHSSIKAVLNQEPSLIKTFNTINYEGTQAYIAQPANAQITPNNAMAAHLASDIAGWECPEIVTNSDKGSIYEFIKKEGKWFNYIKGSHVDINNVDTSLFSVQGIGVVDNVTDVVLDPNEWDADLIMPEDSGDDGNGGNDVY
tara:strand:- start:5116 stop:14982 length:9867 start_codon:yes stop_codon:yes gene_type:complete